MRARNPTSAVQRTSDIDSGRPEQPWPDTLTVATPYAGLHLYFRVPHGAAAASAISRWLGIDIRAPGYRSGGYLAGPGSVVDGAEYLIDRDVPATPLAGQPAHPPGAGVEGVVVQEAADEFPPLAGAGRGAGRVSNSPWVPGFVSLPMVSNASPTANGRSPTARRSCPMTT